jgi:probable rRNA maturation factor
MKLTIFNETESKIPDSLIKKLFKNMYSEMLDESALGMVNIIITDDKKMKSLNKEYRNKNMATDVLSFNIDYPTKDENVFGEIYISSQTALKQADKLKVTLEDEYLRLVCHGLLHLLGYDHLKKKDEKIMTDHEEYYLNNI